MSADAAEKRLPQEETPDVPAANTQPESFNESGEPDVDGWFISEEIENDSPEEVARAYKQAMDNREEAHATFKRTWAERMSAVVGGRKHWEAQTRKSAYEDRVKEIEAARDAELQTFLQSHETFLQRQARLEKNAFDQAEAQKPYIPSTETPIEQAIHDRKAHAVARSTDARLDREAREQAQDEADELQADIELIEADRTRLADIRNQLSVIERQRQLLTKDFSKRQPEETEWNDLMSSIDDAKARITEHTEERKAIESDIKTLETFLASNPDLKEDVAEARKEELRRFKKTRKRLTNKERKARASLSRHEARQAELKPIIDEIADLRAEQAKNPPVDRGAIKQLRRELKAAKRKVKKHTPDAAVISAKEGDLAILEAIDPTAQEVKDLRAEIDAMKAGGVDPAAEAEVQRLEAEIAALRPDTSALDKREGELKAELEEIKQQMATHSLPSQEATQRERDAQQDALRIRRVADAKGRLFGEKAPERVASAEERQRAMDDAVFYAKNLPGMSVYARRALASDITDAIYAGTFKPWEEPDIHQAVERFAYGNNKTEQHVREHGSTPEDALAEVEAFMEKLAPKARFTLEELQMEMGILQNLQEVWRKNPNNTDPVAVNRMFEDRKAKLQTKIDDLNARAKDILQQYHDQQSYRDAILERLNHEDAARVDAVLKEPLGQKTHGDTMPKGLNREDQKKAHEARMLASNTDEALVNEMERLRAQYKALTGKNPEDRPVHDNDRTEVSEDGESGFAPKNAEYQVFGNEAPEDELVIEAPEDEEPTVEISESEPTETEEVPEIVHPENPVSSAAAKKIENLFKRLPYEDALAKIKADNPHLVPRIQMLESQTEAQLSRVVTQAGRDMEEYRLRLLEATPKSLPSSSVFTPEEAHKLLPYTLQDAEQIYLIASRILEQKSFERMQKEADAAIQKAHKEAKAKEREEKLRAQEAKHEAERLDPGHEGVETLDSEGKSRSDYKEQAKGMSAYELFQAIGLRGDRSINPNVEPNAVKRDGYLDVFTERFDSAQDYSDELAISKSMYPGASEYHAYLEKELAAVTAKERGKQMPFLDLYREVGQLSADPNADELEVEGLLEALSERRWAPETIKEVRDLVGTDPDAESVLKELGATV